MPRTHLTYGDEDIAHITKLREAGDSWPTIAALYKTKPKTLQAMWGARTRRIKRGYNPTTEDFAAHAEQIVFKGTNPKEPPDWETCLDGLAEARAFRKRFSISDRSVACHIDTKEPIALAFVTDVHLGSPHTDYEAFRSDVKAVLADDRVYVMKGGDWSDKFMPTFKDASAPANQVAPPMIQMITEDQVMKALDGRIVAACGGNHDRMDEKKTGMSSEYWIHRDKPFPYMPTGGRIELVVGKTEYRILWTHQYGTGNSRLNTHNVFNWIRRELDPTCDIYALEHHHDPSLMIREVQDFDKRTVIEMRTGSYKSDDRYSEQFFKAGRLGPQTIVLWPDQKKMVPFHNASAITDASAQLRGQNGTKA